MATAAPPQQQQAQGQTDQYQAIGFAAPAPMYNAVVNDRPAFAHVAVYLNQGQSIMADGGAMLWMDGTLQMETACGDCGPACYRSCAGESCCQNTFHGPGNVSFGFKLPGDCLPFAVTPDFAWILTSGAFICGTPNIKITARFAGCCTCCCGGESAFLTKIESPEGAGMFYAGGYGALSRHEIPAGKTMFIDDGLFFAAHADTDIEVGIPGGCISCLYGGEGIVMKFHGPAVVYTQNRNPAIWNKLLNPPPKKENSPGGAAN